MKRRIKNIFLASCFFLSLSLSGLYAEIVRPKQESDESNLRDPFRDYFEESAPFEEGEGKDVSREAGVPLPTLTVQGIVSGGRLNQAIINNKIVKAGDTIEGAVITNINKEGVSVFFSNKTYKLSSPAADITQDLKKEPEGGQDEK